MIPSREARPASAAWNLAKAWMHTAVFWTVFLGLIPWGIYWLESRLGLANWRFGDPAWLGFGIALFVFGGALGLTCSVFMAVRGGGTPLPIDCARQLVLVGPYRFVRNPMAIAGLAQAVAVGLCFGSPAIVFYGLVGGPIWHLFVRPWEEADLLARFGEPYRRYRAAVSCWLPRLTPYRVE